MLFVTGLFIYHSKLVMKNITTKEDIKSYWDNSQGNPYYRNKKLNIINSIFPKKQKYSIIDIFKKGFLFLVPLNEENPLNNDNNNNKEKEVSKGVNVIENNLTDSPLQNDNNTSSPIKSEYNNTNNHIQNKFNYQKEKENENNDEARNLSTAYKTGNKINKENNLNNSNNSNFINVQNNNLNNEQRHNSIRSFDINIELNDEKIKRKTFGIAENERYSIPMNNSVINNNMRRSTVRISDCSEKITDASGERKVPLFEANFESEIHNVKVKPAERDKI